MAESSYVLKIQYIQKPAETRTISAPVITIGRDQGEIVLGDAQASGRHAEIRLANGKVAVHDLGSTNGILIDGIRHQDAALHPGQTFVCGQTAMTILAIHGARQQVGGGRTMIAMGAPPGLGLPPPGLGMPPAGGLPPMGGMPQGMPQGGMPQAGGMPPMGAMPQGGMPPAGGMPQGMPPAGGMSPMGGMPQAGGMPPMGASSGGLSAAVDEAPIRVTEPLTPKGLDHPGAGLLSKGPLAVLESAPPLDSKPAGDGSVAPETSDVPGVAEEGSQEPGSALLVPPPPTGRSGPSAALVVIAVLLALAGAAAGIYFFGIV